MLLTTNTIMWRTRSHAALGMAISPCYRRGISEDTPIGYMPILMTFEREPVLLRAEVSLSILKHVDSAPEIIVASLLHHCHAR